MGKIRIIGGIHRSRQLSVLDVDGLRPTLDRVKETLFNWLGQDLTGLECLDLFAGSGSLGFEAISRNAKHVVMIEKDIRVSRKLLENKNLLKAENCEVINGDAIHYMCSSNRLFDIIFVDPPYSTNLLSDVLPLLRKLIKDDGLIYAEYSNEVDFNGFDIYKKGKAGLVNYVLLRVI